MPSRSRENQGPLTASLEHDVYPAPGCCTSVIARPSLSRRPTVSRGEPHAHRRFGPTRTMKGSAVVHSASADTESVATTASPTSSRAEPRESAPYPHLHGTLGSLP